MSKDAAVPMAPKWDTVVLVCKACRKRSKGPKDLKPKAVATLVRQLAREVGQRPRIVLTDCLGLCPKAATAVATVGHDVKTQIVAVRSRDSVAAVLPSMRQRTVSSASALPVALPTTLPNDDR